ncbi:hypothetical protein FE257_005384 [Aspergillus nanangensis]|uniref:Cytochrome b5 heme-binding domain-containing protein n=1 Tax=Aspergillus nanangensis TaxID=2582783 RepID=A0AAD4CR03_ASPNN|nr:hypothetical protein FE257_005384 [Aspergillus nanangensis]
MAEEPETQYSKEEVAKHTTDGDMWVIIDNGVYDMSPFQDQHPGGKRILLTTAGTDASKKYHKYHSDKAMTRYGDALRIGVVQLSQQEKIKQKKSLFSRILRSS